MFSQIFVERALVDHPQAHKILKQFQALPVHVIEQYDHVWGKFKKPYLLKREDLSLFLAQKKGQLIKLAPDAYGHGKEKHFYFIHAYNCIYECEYCYLQGYFSTPDLVVFLNHEDIIKEMESILKEDPDAWFHAGEFSDSLALSHLTGELSVYFDFFRSHPQAHLELRTKSVNLKALKMLEPLQNVIVSFSLSPDYMARRVDQKAPSLKARIRAMKELEESGFRLAIHLDPIIAVDEFEELYRGLFAELSEHDLLKDLHYVSIGVVRFTDEVMGEVKRNYPQSLLLAQNFLKAQDNKIKYPAPYRKHVLDTVYDLGLRAGLRRDQLYLCME